MADDTVTTQIEVDRELWQFVRQRAVIEGVTVSEGLEQVLAEHFER